MHDRSRTVAVLAVCAIGGLRLFHSGVLWVEEAYPMAGALEMLHGRVPYRDFWYDKPPLVPLFYLLCGAAPGIPLRLLGLLFTAAAAWCAYGFARDLWTEQEGRWAAILTAFTLVFGFPATVMAIAPDLFLVLPHFAAVWLAWRGRAFGSGVVAGVALLAHFKAVFIVLACLAVARNARFLAGLMGPLALAFGALWWLDAWPAFVGQVWEWGGVYAAQPLRPWGDGIVRTLATLGYWSGLAGAALVFLWREPRGRWGWAGWLALMLTSAWLGARFFPRYYFALVPPLALMAARGLAWSRWPAWLLVIPLIRFGPGVVNPPAADLALFDDARVVARQVSGARTVFVWGYRPEISVLTRASSGTPFLESQPLTGVFADRHLSTTTQAADGKTERLRLRGSRPEVIVDGLGLLNPALAIGAYPDLAEWLAGYREAGRTKTCIIYRSSTAPAFRETR